MSQIQGIERQYRERSSVAEFIISYGVNPKTVRKYLKHDDFTPKPPEKKITASILDPYKPLINGYLSEDQRRWLKQRYIAKRFHNLFTLKFAGYACFYNTVQLYVKRIFKAQRTVRVSMKPVSPR